jgi:hypothetical protein
MDTQRWKKISLNTGPKKPIRKKTRLLTSVVSAYLYEKNQDHYNFSNIKVVNTSGFLVLQNKLTNKE